MSAIPQMAPMNWLSLFAFFSVLAAVAGVKLFFND